MLKHRSIVVASLLVWAVTAPGSGALATGAGCEDRAAWLADAEAGVRDMLGDLVTLRDESDLARLANVGYGYYPHHRVSFERLGWAVLDTLAPQDPAGAQPVPRRPSILSYAPSGSNVTDAHESFDFPYRLAGWAYAFPFDFGTHPTEVIVDGEPVGDFSCIARSEWFVHERGVHRFQDGGMTTQRPDADEEAVHGTSPAAVEVDPTILGPGDVPHGRVWDVHVWTGDDAPVVSMLSPQPIPGLDAHVGSSPPTPDEPDPWFFHPPRAADLALTNVGPGFAVQLRTSFTHTLTTTNDGPDTATGVVLRNPVPKGAVVVSTSADTGDCMVSKGTVTCGTAVLAPGATWTVSIELKATRTGTVVDTASVSATERDLEPNDDPRLGWRDGSADNTATSRTEIVR